MRADLAKRETSALQDKIKLFSAMSDSAGATPEKIKRCLLCKDALEGTAVEAKEGFFHQACFKCDKCSGPISGSFLRALEKKWHNECFSCTTCGCSLSENYYMHENMPYCRDHYIIASCERCKHCTLPIETEFVYGLNDWMYHVGCFKCEVCEKPLEQYFVKDNKAFCLEDFLTQFGDDCHKCNSKISGAMHAVDGVAAADGLKWHTECFTCSVCDKPLETEVFFHEGMLYCREDLYKTFASHCNGCGQPIEGPCVNAMDNVWHPQCFVCDVCGTLLEGSFMMKDNVPFCRPHFLEKFAEKCFGCKTPVAGSIINAIGHKWHPKCFKCRVSSMAFSIELL